jgi:UDP-N-acetylmuramoyl-L-alanyl-D-glutamate--2,6-diaminopimelate ligase
VIQPDFMVGVTGTNGKTSVTQWIAQALDARGRKCAIVGTLGNGFIDELVAGPNTTPGAHVLREFLPESVRQGAQACAMEVSSIGLHQSRVAGIHFDVAVFTNLTRDHLDYHRDMAEYAAMKRKLFEIPGLGCAVLNLDDAFGRELAISLKEHVRTLGYTLENATGTDRVLHATNLSESGTGLAFTLDGVRFEAPVVGRFNASNLLAVIGTLLAGNEKLGDIAPVLRQIVPPAGRMQPVGGNVEQGVPLVVVDYAHTPDALEQVLTTLRGTTQARGGQLLCVFGCGGDRDPGKRPQMGAIAERLADAVVVTSDNPRSEDPQAIIAQILAGMTSKPAVEADRAAAINAAIAAADARDVILLAGKGHEPYQEIAGVRTPFSDLECAKSALARPHAGGPPAGGRHPC